MTYHYPPTLVDILELWSVLPTTYCERRYMQRLLLLLEGATTGTRTADTNSWTELRRLHYHPSKHVSACLGSATLRGSYGDGSILRLTRDD